MNFFRDKVKKYQEKKLAEAKQKLEYYKESKKNLEKLLNNSTHKEKEEIQEKIVKQGEFIEIWTKNIESIKKELKKLKS